MWSARRRRRRRGGLKEAEGRRWAAAAELQQSFSTSLSLFYVPSELLSASPFVSGLVKVTDEESSGIRLITPLHRRRALPSLLHAFPSFAPHARALKRTLQLLDALMRTPVSKESTARTNIRRADKTPLLCLATGDRHLLMRRWSMHVCVCA